MQSRLIIKKFGPIEDVDLNLKNVNVFIGPQASGKSALAKLYTICKSPMAFIKYENESSLKIDKEESIERFKKELQDYNVFSFWSNQTEIVFTSELHDIIINDKLIIYDRKIFKKINEIKSINFRYENQLLIDKIVEFNGIFFNLYLYISSLIKENVNELLTNDKIRNFISGLDEAEFNKIIDLLEITEKTLSHNPALYIPAERSFIPIIATYTLSLLNNGVPIPKHILSFGAEYEKSRDLVKEIKLDFILKDLKYGFENGQDIVYLNENYRIKLTEAASGIQSVVPMLLSLELKKDKAFRINNSFVIEEPELNLFPKTQYSLINNIEKNRVNPFFFITDHGTIHTYTTHSPYVLSSFNNFLYAGKLFDKIEIKSRKEGKDYRESSKIASEVLNSLNIARIRPDNFSAYQICDGKAISIFDTSTGLIKSNFIDEASDEMQDDFDKIMDLMNEYDRKD